jgi:hypothetical protein
MPDLAGSICDCGNPKVFQNACGGRKKLCHVLVLGIFLALGLCCFYESMSYSASKNQDCYVLNLEYSQDPDSGVTKKILKTATTRKTN